MERVIAGHVLVQKRFSEIVFLTKFQERHKHCVSRILDPFPNIIMIKVNYLSILEMNVIWKTGGKRLWIWKENIRQTASGVLI